VQSPGYDPSVLDDRIETCFEVCKVCCDHWLLLIHLTPQKNLHSLTPKDFQLCVDVLIQKKLQKDKRLEEEFERLWSEITLHNYQFDRAQQEINMLKTVTHDELLNFFEKYFTNKGTRAKLSIRHVAKQKWNTYKEEVKTRKDVIVITDVNKFKRCSFLWPSPSYVGKLIWAVVPINYEEDHT